MQTIAPGDEYTVDVLVNRQGRGLCAVPRKRLEVRGGEISKGMTERQESLVALTRRLAETLPGAYGALNVQVFWDLRHADQQHHRDQRALRRRLPSDLASRRAISPMDHRGDPRPLHDHFHRSLERPSLDVAV